MTHLTSLPEYRTIWISDLHLGTRGCKAEFLLDFLKYTEAETIYLVGDIIDGWRLKKSWYWPQAHNDVIQKVLRKVRKGTRVIYVPGNHDEWLRDFTQLQVGGVEVVEDAIHVTADGRRLLVIHGDAFDAVVMHARWLALLGDGAYSSGRCEFVKIALAPMRGRLRSTVSRAGSRSCGPGWHRRNDITPTQSIHDRQRKCSNQPLIPNPCLYNPYEHQQ